MKMSSDAQTWTPASTTATAAMSTTNAARIRAARGFCLHAASMRAPAATTAYDTRGTRGRATLRADSSPRSPLMRRAIQTPKAPTPIGPYSQGVVRAPFLFTAGQVGIDPASRKLVAGGIEAETRQA